MRRTVRGQDKPYAIFEPFGGRPNGDFNETEDYVRSMIAKVAEGQRDSDCRFDLLSMEFWVDYNGDLRRCDPARFPGDLTAIREDLRAAGIHLGLWIDSSICGWSIGGNPATHASIMQDRYREGFGATVYCRATEPIRSMFTQAFRYHIRENGARLFKFDNLLSQCDNPTHAHLPGIYSREPIFDAIIEFLHALDEESPDVFLMLYWGYRSPWWLLHADTMFETGVEMEAASPGDLPAPYARAGVTRKLDQGHTYAKDVPWLGTDSLGMWLSHWPWNSEVGPERWQEGFAMDICRGNMLAQPWSDPEWLNPGERRQMGEFIALLKAAPGCFGNSRLILGDPWKPGPYGYCCTDGTRAFMALNNATWEDRAAQLELNAAWGLPDGRRWDLYRWYPDPARLVATGGSLGDTASFCMRPFEVALLEAVPHGRPPTLGRAFDDKPLPTRFGEASRPISIGVREPLSARHEPDPAVFTPLEVLEARSEGGATLTVQQDGSVLASGPCPSPDTYVLTARTELTGITGLLVETLPDDSLPGGGPGRAENGNFQLSELSVTAAPWDGSAPGAPVVLRDAEADYSQTGYGGWPVAAAIDGNPATAWSIDPAEGAPHVALFRTTTPVGSPGSTRLTVRIAQGEREHTLGRFRLFVTNAAAPKLPTGYGQAPWRVTGRVPRSRNGGLLVVSMEMLRGGEPLMIGNLGDHMSLEATVAGAPAEFQSVLGRHTYPSSWQSWRLEVTPETAGRPFELTVGVTGLPSRELRWSAHYIPRDAAGGP
jgi:hypothetical protein